jgi:hypothetical protein
MEFEMNRETIEQKIAEASDGLLSSVELEALEEELKSWPELQQDYYDIVNLPEIETVFPAGTVEQHSDQINHLLGMLEKQNHNNEHFTELSLHIFKKYALAASILIIAGSSALFMSNDSVELQNSASAEQLFTYQAEGEAIDNYMVQMDNLLLDGNSDE